MQTSLRRRHRDRVVRRGIGMIIESDFYSTEAGRAHFQDQLTSKSMTTPRPPVESFLLANLFSHFLLSVLCAIVCIKSGIKYCVQEVRLPPLLPLTATRLLPVHVQKTDAFFCVDIFGTVTDLQL